MGVSSVFSAGDIIFGIGITSMIASYTERLTVPQPRITRPLGTLHVLRQFGAL